MPQADSSANSQIIGIFGGTFDPVHLSHLRCLKTLAKEIDFTCVYWVLSARPPHKDQTSASIDHRYTMLELALQDNPKFIADDTEIKHQHDSYTIHTLQHFRQRFPQACLCLIVGSDSLEKLESWYRYQEITELANIVSMSRPGYSSELPKFLINKKIDELDKLVDYAAGKVVVTNHTEFDVSSTDIRKRLKAEKPVNKLLSKAVIDYIHQHNLYQTDKQTMNSKQTKDQVVDSLEDLKAIDITVMDIADISDFADYMIVASGTSNTHVKALARETSTKLRKAGVKPLNENGADIGEWVLVDFGDVVLHVMRPQVREYYELEKFWDEDVRNMVKQHRAQQE